jgi:hypothetical protein
VPSGSISVSKIGWDGFVQSAFFIAGIVWLACFGL